MANKPRSASIHPGPGFRVRVNFHRPPSELIRSLAQFPTPEISDLLNRLYAVDPEIRCLTQSAQQIYGSACTVKVFPGDNLMVHKALDVIEPGDVIIVDAGGSRLNAVMGDLVSTKAKHRGAAGFVVDGLVRDLPNIEPLAFPVFARGASPIGPLHRGPGEINYAICCGGVVVNPGDIIIGDSMGVVIVPPDIAAELLQRLQSHESANAEYLESVRRGDFSNEWVDRVLREHQCPLIRGEAGVANGDVVAEPAQALPAVEEKADGASGAAVVG